MAQSVNHSQFFNFLIPLSSRLPASVHNSYPLPADRCHRYEVLRPNFQISASADYRNLDRSYQVDRRIDAIIGLAIYEATHARVLGRLVDLESAYFLYS